MNLRECALVELGDHGIVIQTLLDLLPHESISMQIATGKTLLDMMERDVCDGKLANGFLNCIHRMMDSRDQEVLDVWSQVMLHAIIWMTLDVLESEVRGADK